MTEEENDQFFALAVAFSGWLLKFPTYEAELRDQLEFLDTPLARLVVEFYQKSENYSDDFFENNLPLLNRIAQDVNDFQLIVLLLYQSDWNPLCLWLFSQLKNPNEWDRILVSLIRHRCGKDASFKDLEVFVNQIELKNLHTKRSFSESLSQFISHRWSNFLR